MDRANSNNKNQDLTLNDITNTSTTDVPMTATMKLEKTVTKRNGESE